MPHSYEYLKLEWYYIDSNNKRQPIFENYNQSNDANLTSVLIRDRKKLKQPQKIICVVNNILAKNGSCIYRTTIYPVPNHSKSVINLNIVHRVK